MRVDETKQIFLELAGHPLVERTDPTIVLPGVSLRTLWSVFKQFANIPLDAQHQSFSFGSQYDPEWGGTLICCRWHFSIPAQNDPALLRPLFFEAAVHYPTTPPSPYENAFFLVKVEADLKEAVAALAAYVEEEQALWRWVEQQEHGVATIFQ